MSPSRAGVLVTAAGTLMVLAAAMVAGASGASRAGAADASAYADSADRALQILRDPGGDERAAARRAADVLEAGTGQSQREILLELRQAPPDVADARGRLTALSHAARSRAFTPESANAQGAVRGIMAQPRYAALHQGPSLGDRVRDILLQVLVWVLDRVGGAVSKGFGLLAAAAAAGLGLVVVVVARSARWRGRREARLRAGAGPGPAPRDRFADADRLAAAGDLAGAVRALAGAVAVSLDGDRAWEVGPLTVREIFAGAPDPSALRPLLQVFEAAVYGDRAPDADAYRRAAAVAAGFRPHGRAAA